MVLWVRACRLTMHNMQIDFMNEVKYKDNAWWHCEKPQPLLLLYGEPPSLVKTGFWIHLATTCCGLTCALLKKKLGELHAKTTQKVKDYGRYNTGEKERYLGMERHTLLRASGNEEKYVEEWAKKAAMILIETEVFILFYFFKASCKGMCKTRHRGILFTRFFSPLHSDKPAGGGSTSPTWHLASAHLRGCSEPTASRGLLLQLGPL